MTINPRQSRMPEKQFRSMLKAAWPQIPLYDRH